MLERFNFSNDFQDVLLASMSRFPEKFLGVDSIIDPRFFTGVNSGATCKLMLAYHKEFGIFPTFTSLGQLAIKQGRKNTDGDLSHDLVEYIKALSELDTRDADFAKKEVITFARERALLGAAHDVVGQIQSGKEITYNLIEKFQAALNLGNSLTELGYDARDDAAKVLEELIKPHAGVNSGYELFDNLVWKRGMRDGWLIVPLAPPKSYKTTFCLNLARHICGPNVGENVVYYACEIDEKLALQRFYQALTQKTEDDLFADPINFAEALADGLELKLKGNLFVKHFAAKSATINDIRAHLKTLIAVKGWAPRVIVLDYAETIKPSDSEGSEHRINASIYTEARQLADEFKVTVIMPDRCNKETVEQPVPTMTSFQGAFEKAGIVDVAFGLCNTPEEQDRGILRFFVFLNRHGSYGLHFRGNVDRERMTISITERLEWEALRAMEDNHQENRRAGRAGRGGRRGQNRVNDAAVAAIEREG